MNKINIIDFGASCSCDDNAQFIQSAIDAAEGGGTVVVPKGVYYTSTLYLKSDITLYLEDGARIKAVSDVSKYAENGFYDSFGQVTNSFIIAKNCENTSIEGKGIIDISGYDFLDYSITDEDRKLWGEYAGEIPARPNERIRRPILFDKCKNIHISDIKLINSPCWTLTFNNCDDIKISGITVDNDIRTPHSDGIHICGSQNAIITGCNLKCGDDCVALTCLLEESLICRNIVISNCIMQSSSAAIRVGHIGGRVENVLVSNVCIHDTNRGLAVFAGDNGYVKNVSVSNVIMDTHILAGGWWGRGEPFVICSANSSGVIDNVRISGLSAKSENIGVVAGNVTGLAITDSNIQIVNSDKRSLASSFDIAPNGKLCAENDFSGSFYAEQGIEIIIK